MRIRLLMALTALIASAASIPVSGIVNGKSVTAAEQQQKGLVSVNGGCSGVLIVNDWVLTAGHCAEPNRTNPNNIRVTFLGTTILANAVYLFGGYADEVGPDIALLHLSAPFTIAGHSTGFQTQFWGGQPHDLFGKTVAFYGIGRTDCAGPAAGLGPYRAADFTVDSGDYSATTRPNNPTVPPTATNFFPSDGGYFYRISRNASAQIPRPGDSGGPSFIFENGTPMLVGIQSGGSCADPSGGSVTGSGSANQVSIARLRRWIDDVFRTKWTPNAQSQPVYVYPSEVSGTRWDLSDVNTVHWAQAARAAAAMCYDRGFAAGHFDGHQGVLPPVPGSGFGLQCSGGDTLWLDVTTAQMDQQWRFFGDINSVNWAVAARAAERICATRGYAGGQFNGHQRGAHYGLFCYRGGAQWFDAGDADLAATGWGFPTPKLDDNLWAQASRAATGFCRAKGFSGGFMNGQHVPNRSGVVCQK
jgi:hypothetical protein